MSWYTPDFALIDTTNKIYIDIEIDEPYTPRQYPNCDSELKLTHCLDDDNSRNKCFTDAGWFVIRFSEQQVLLYPESCCKVIAQLLSECTGNGLVLNKFSRIPDLQPETQWTREEAIAKAKNQERLNYNCIHSAPAQTRIANSQQNIEAAPLQTQKVPPSSSPSQNFKSLRRQRLKLRKKLGKANTELIAIQQINQAIESGIINEKEINTFMQCFKEQSKLS